MKGNGFVASSASTLASSIIGTDPKRPCSHSQPETTGRLSVGAFLSFSQAAVVNRKRPQRGQSVSTVPAAEPISWAVLMKHIGQSISDTYQRCYQAGSRRTGAGARSRSFLSTTIVFCGHAAAPPSLAMNSPLLDRHPIAVGVACLALRRRSLDLFFSAGGRSTSLKIPTASPLVRPAARGGLRRGSTE
jgi:hypothetical protein